MNVGELIRKLQEFPQDWEVTVPLRDHDAGGNVFVDEDAGVASDVEVENGPRPSLIRYMDSLGGYSFRLATNTVMIKSGNLE